jgi:hypothetical protein
MTGERDKTVTTTGYLAFGAMVVCVLLYIMRRRSRLNREQ